MTGCGLLRGAGPRAGLRAGRPPGAPLALVAGVALAVCMVGTASAQPAPAAPVSPSAPRDAAAPALARPGLALPGVGLPGGAPAAAAGAIGGQQATATPSPVTVSAELLGPDGKALGPKGKLKLGEPATLRVIVTAPVDAKVFVPSNPLLEPFKTRGEPPAPVRQEQEGQAVEIHDLPVVALRVGAKAVPPIEVTWRTPDGSSGSVLTDRLRARVVGRIVNEQDPALAGPPGPVSVIATNWFLVWSVSIFGAALVAAVLTLIALFFLRRYLAAAVPPPPARPANEVALERLASLSIEELTSAERYSGVIHVLREYLAGRYRIDALEMTTRELMRALVGEDLKEITDTEIRSVLEDADLVKFARLEPSDEEARGLISTVRRVVVATWEAPEPDEVEPGHVRLDPAPASARMRAGMLDVALAGAIGLLVLGGTWVAGGLQWGWVSAVVTGALLLVRDLAGPGSPGKLLLGLRVVQRTELQGSPSAGERLLRNALLLVAPIGLPMETLVLIHHPLRYRLGDLWARTEVVEDLLAAPSKPSKASKASPASKPSEVTA